MIVCNKSPCCTLTSRQVTPQAADQSTAAPGLGAMQAAGRRRQLQSLLRHLAYGQPSQPALLSLCSAALEAQNPEASGRLHTDALGWPAQLGRVSLTVPSAGQGSEPAHQAEAAVCRSRTRCCPGWRAARPRRLLQRDVPAERGGPGQRPPSPGRRPRKARPQSKSAEQQALRGGPTTLGQTPSPGGAGPPGPGRRASLRSSRRGEGAPDPQSKQPWLPRPGRAPPSRRSHP